MSNPPTCPKCGAELLEDAPAGLCPKCLVEVGLESALEPDSDKPQSDPGDRTVDSPSPGSRFVPPSAAELAHKFPQLEIINLAGYGGMGAVYKARQTNLDRIVALKIIRPEATHDPAFAERFNREAKTLARLSHQNIVGVHDFGEIELSDAANRIARPVYYFLMEYVDGTDLRQLIRAKELAPKQALAIVPQICDALQYAHNEGVVHRDIKPENILIDRSGRVKVADFGLAKLATQSEGEVTLTGTHQVMGTLRYMAPEQMEGSHAVDHRADIYSLGVVFYEMLTGEAPLGHFEPPSEKVEIDVRLDEVVLRTLARDPERRYQQVSEVKTDVDDVSTSAKTMPRAKTNPEKTPAWFWWANAAIFLGVWILTAAMWNYGKWGLYASGAALTALHGVAVRRRLGYIVPSRVEAATFHSAARNFRWLLGVSVLIVGYVMLLNAQITSWDLCGFPEPIEAIGKRISASPHRLIRELKAFREAIPTVELVMHGGVRHVNFSNFQELLFYWLFGIGLVLTSSLTLLKTPTYKWSWKGHWKPSFSVTSSLLAPLLLLTGLTHFTGGSLHGRHELRSDADAEQLASVLSDWVDKYGYQIRSDGQWHIHTVPEGKTIGTLHLAQLEVASVFERWKTTFGAVVEQSPSFEIELVSSIDPVESIIRIEPRQAMIGPRTLWSKDYPHRDLERNLVAALEAAAVTTEESKVSESERRSAKTTR